MRFNVVCFYDLYLIPNTLLKRRLRDDVDTDYNRFGLFYVAFYAAAGIDR
jgi:hypothetical protein